jgi:hypothetical protein
MPHTMRQVDMSLSIMKRRHQSLGSKVFIARVHLEQSLVGSSPFASCLWRIIAGIFLFSRFLYASFIRDYD